MSREITLPLGLMSDAALAGRGEGRELVLHVPKDYDSLLKSAVEQSEVLGVQRLLTLARNGRIARISWAPEMAARIEKSASLYPLLAVAILLQGVAHFVARPGADDLPLLLDAARKSVLRHSLSRDMFSDSDIVVCADSLGVPPPRDLYQPGTRRLRAREDFEALVIDALTAQGFGQLGDSFMRGSASALGVIVAELFENTEVHGRYTLSGAPVGPDSVRGLILRRVSFTLPSHRIRNVQVAPRSIDCFELSVFDAGLGYFSSYLRKHLDESVDLNEEWKVLHNCLVRHYHPELEDRRAGHRAMGLYEVLRAIQSLKGRIEFRTGRLFAYRTFMDGEVQALLEEKAEFAHRAWPKPRLLDVERRYVALPSEHERLVGASVRVLVPLQ